MRKRLRIVIDTNVFVSALLGSRSCREIIQAFKAKRFTPVLSKSLIEEISRVILDNRISSFSPAEVTELFNSMEEAAEVVEPRSSVKLCRDPKDNKILETAVSAKADLIITGDKDLLILKVIEDIPIITPREFMKSLKRL